VNRLLLTIQDLTLFVIISVFALGIIGCAPVPPNQPMNICRIYTQYPKWYWASQKVTKKWGLSEPVQMAIIFQESSYDAYAKPPREKLLWLIPWKRPTTATGYAQATDGAWENYIRHTGNSDASRANFADAVDFIGWYSYVAHQRLGINPNNAYELYLAYHEGINAYNHYDKHSDRQKWLEKIAVKVDRLAKRYQVQLQNCRKNLPKKHWWSWI
jgi:hypothetical protein